MPRRRPSILFIKAEIEQMPDGQHNCTLNARFGRGPAAFSGSRRCETFEEATFWAQETIVKAMKVAKEEKVDA